MGLLCYAAGPFSSAPFIRASVHERLRAIGVEPTSRWAEEADGPEDFSRFSPERLQSIAASNDADLRGSDVLLLVDLAGTGRETYGELARAQIWGKPVVWLARPSLSMYRNHVLRADDLGDAIRLLVEMRDLHAEGHRGLMLAQLASKAVAA